MPRQARKRAESGIYTRQGTVLCLDKVARVRYTEKGDIYAKTSQKAGRKKDRGRFCVLRETPTPIR